MARQLTVDNLKKQLEKLPPADRDTIVHIWSLFADASASYRSLILQGLLTQCSLRELSFLADSLNDLIRIDFITALPSELSFKILSLLDASSLCHAAQVSKTWNRLADDDLIWNKMCEQHIDKKCTKCGWGLPPLLEHRQRHHASFLNQFSQNNQANPAQQQATFPLFQVSKLTTPISTTPTKTRPWKHVYLERLMVEKNWRKGRYTIRTLRGHQDGILCLQFNDNILITGSYDSTVRVWNIQTGETIRVLTGHHRAVRALQFDDAKLITCSMDRTLKIWHYQTGQCINTLEGHTEGVTCLHYDDHILVSGSADAMIKVWNFQSSECHTLVGHREMVNHVVIYQKTFLFSCSDDTTIRLWDLTTRNCIRILSGHVAQVQCIQPAPSLECMNQYMRNEKSKSGNNHHRRAEHILSPEEHTLPVLVSASLDHTIKIWSTQTGDCLRTLFGHVEGVWALSFDRLRLVTGAEDKMVKVWDLESGKCLHTLNGHSGAVNCVSLADTRVITADEDGEIRIWDFRN